MTPESLFPKPSPAPGLDPHHPVDTDAKSGLRKMEGGMRNKDTEEVQGRVTDVEKMQFLGN